MFWFTTANAIEEILVLQDLFYDSIIHISDQGVTSII